MASRLYDTQKWKRRRVAFLREHPLCVFCLEAGRSTLATVVDHIDPHGGDEALFWDESNWAAMCKPCHDGAKKEIEKTGKLRGCDASGMPLDPAHPWHVKG